MRGNGRELCEGSGAADWRAVAREVWVLRYLGGKSRIAKALAKTIRERMGARPFWEPFCGGLSMSVALGGPGVVSDGHPALIALYEAVASGWDPPAVVSREERDAALALPDSDPFKAFARFGCGFGGNWSSGYAGNDAQNDYADASRKAVLRDVRAIVSAGCRIGHVDFLSVEPAPIGDHFLYLDPPYAGTTGYSIAFDYDRFLVRVREWSRFAEVFVSEYAFPLGVCVWEKPCVVHMTRARSTKNERLFFVAKGSL